MIEVRYTPGTAIAAWGQRIAVLADLRGVDPLRAELAALASSPDIGTQEVLELLVSRGAQQVGDFAIAEELDDGTIRLVLRGAGGWRVGGVGTQGRGMWRSRVVTADEVELYAAAPGNAEDHPAAWETPDPGAALLASALAIHRAKPAGRVGPRRALAAPEEPGVAGPSWG